MASFDRFLALHRPGTPLLIPNPWDVGSARLLASLGFEALATTSGGFAATLGRLDGSVTRDEAIAHSAAVVSATDLPVSADLENGFADDPSSVAETVRLARGAGLAGCSIEDATGRSDEPVYDVGLAAERIAAAAEAAHRGPDKLVLTGRAENYCTGTGTWPTPSPGSSPTRRRAPTCSTRRASATGTRSVRWSRRWTGP